MGTSRYEVEDRRCRRDVGDDEQGVPVVSMVT